MFYALSLREGRAKSRSSASGLNQYSSLSQRLIPKVFAVDKFLVNDGSVLFENLKELCFRNSSHYLEKLRFNTRPYPSKEHGAGFHGRR